MYITAKQLERSGANCGDMIQFRKVFGECVELTPKNIEKAVKRKLDVYAAFDYTPLKQFDDIKMDFYWARDDEGQLLFYDCEELAVMALLTIAAELDGKGADNE